VYGGIDPVTKRRHYLKEIVPAGPRAQAAAEAVRPRPAAQVAECHNPRTSAAVDQLLDRYLSQFDGAPNTLRLYRGYVRNHISPPSGRPGSGTSTRRFWTRFTRSSTGAGSTARRRRT
jgi:hypothetical protein